MSLLSGNIPLPTKSIFQQRLLLPLMMVILITVTAPLVAQTFQSHQSIYSAARSFLSRHIDNASKHEIIIEKLDARLRLQSCSNELKTFFNSGSRAFGNTTVGVGCQGPNPWTIYIPARVKLYQSVLATRRPLARNSIVNPADLHYIERDLTTLRSGYFTVSQHVIGKVTKRSLPAATIFTPALIQAPRLIVRGETVIIMVEVGGLQVRTTGVALMDGTANQKIKVKNKASKKVVEGIVSAPGVVSVRI